MKSNAFVREEGVRRFPHRYIKFVKSLDGHALRSNREMRKAFREHFRCRFACCPDLPVQEFRCYFVDFPHFRGRVAAKVWLLNAKSVMRWSKSASASHRDWMVCPTQCTWGCCSCLSLFKQICSTISLPREPFPLVLPTIWPHCWRKAAGMFGKT